MNGKGNQRLQVVLYYLARNHVPFGVIEGIVEEISECLPDPEFPEKGMAQWVKDCADRILEDE